MLERAERSAPRTGPRAVSRVRGGRLGAGGGRVRVAAREDADALAVGTRVLPHQTGDLPVAERLGVSEERDGGGEALEVPGEGADEGFVEVVDVEGETAVGVHVRAEVLGVQIAVDPDPAGLLVQERAGVVRTLLVGGGGVGSGSA